jgi:hypothetical protein
VTLRTGAQLVKWTEARTSRAGEGGEGLRFEWGGIGGGGSVLGVEELI